MEEERTTKEQLLQMLAKVQELQRISAGVVMMSVSFRVFSDGDCGICVTYYNVDKMLKTKTSSQVSELTHIVNIYEDVPYARNKTILSAMINHIKEDDAL